MSSTLQPALHLALAMASCEFSTLAWTPLRTELTRQWSQHPHGSLNPLPNLSACTSVRPHRRDNTPASARGRGCTPAGLAPLKRIFPTVCPHSISIPTHTCSGVLGNMWVIALLPHGTHWGTVMAQQHSKKRTLCLDPVCGFPPTLARLLIHSLQQRNTGRQMEPLHRDEMTATCQVTTGFKNTLCV